LLADRSLLITGDRHFLKLRAIEISEITVDRTFKLGSIALFKLGPIALA
ncbi:MAG: hypothetical protein HC849_19865, partial [Oscillatoriales cyanobacterium RU_3_3]|nr:hypothetical protein [Oscillatoriales cyanobacterium RU_3_3]